MAKKFGAEKNSRIIEEPRERVLFGDQRKEATLVNQSPRFRRTSASEPHGKMVRPTFSGVEVEISS